MRNSNFENYALRDTTAEMRGETKRRREERKE
jgi:hypothetical protein